MLEHLSVKLCLRVCVRGADLLFCGSEYTLAFFHMILFRIIQSVLVYKTNNEVVLNV